MKITILPLALFLGLGLAVPAIAQDEPAKEEPAKAAPEAEKPADDAAKPAEEAAEPAEAAAPEAAKEEAPKAAADEAAPEAAKEEAPKAAPAAPEAAKKEETPKAAAPAKELSPCAKTYVPLADSYKKAYDDMQKWIAQIDAQTSPGGEKMRKLQEQIQQNESAITKAKLDGDNSKAKNLTKENKQLWTDFNETKKAQDKVCAAFSKEAAARVKQYADASSKALQPR